LSIEQYSNEIRDPKLQAVATRNVAMNLSLPSLDRTSFSWPRSAISKQQARKDESKDESFGSSSVKMTTPNTSFQSFVEPTPPSKCALRRLPRMKTKHSSDSSSSTSIKEQMTKRWSSIKVNTSSDSEFEVLQDLHNVKLYDVYGDNATPVLSTKLIQEFKENYDLPSPVEDVAGTNAASDRLHFKLNLWNYQSSDDSKCQVKTANSPETAATVPLSFSLDESDPQDDDDDEDCDDVEEGEISAITSELDYSIMFKSKEAKSESPKQEADSPTAATKSHLRLNGLRQLLWPAALVEQSEIKPQSQQQPNYHEDTFEEESTATSKTGFGFLTQAVLSCCGGVVVSAVSSTSPSGFASRSEEDTRCMLDTSMGSFLYLDDEEDKIDEESYDKELQSAFYSPELEASVQHMAKCALAGNCGEQESFEVEQGDDSIVVVQNGAAITLQDTVNVFNLDRFNSFDGGDDANRSSAFSFATDEASAFYTLDDSSCDEATVSEASMVTTPRRNIHRNESVSYDDGELPRLRLKRQESSFSSIDGHGFICS
jgi:hypothetical protein